MFVTPAYAQTGAAGGADMLVQFLPFVLIFVIMYFLIAYELWPQLAGSGPLPKGLVNLQLWLWFVGMLVLSMPWHLVGLLGMPRRMAYYDFTHPDLAPQAWTVTASTLGGLLLVISAGLLIFILATARKTRTEPPPFTFSATVHDSGHTPALLNGFALWVVMMIGLTVVNYGFPIAQLATLEHASVPVVPIGSRW